MCYFLYGAVNGGINESDLAKALNGYDYTFSIGTRSDVNRSVAKDDSYRITRAYCDCDTPIGSGKPGCNGLREFEEMLHALEDVRGIKHVLISKNWAGDVNKSEERVHIADIDVQYFLANIRNNCLYRIELYRKYY